MTRNRDDKGGNVHIEAEAAAGSPLQLLEAAPPGPAPDLAIVRDGEAAGDDAERADRVISSSSMAVAGFPLPEGAPIVGALWSALGLSLPANRQETGRKFLSGKRPLDGEARTGLLRAMAGVFVRAGYVGPLGEEKAHVVVELLATAADHVIAGWDHVVGRVRAVGELGSLTDAAIRYLSFSARMRQAPAS